MSEWVKFIKRNKPIAKWPGGPRFERFMHDAPVDIGSIGVCLDDTRNPPRYYEFDGFYDTKTVDLVLLDSQNKNRMYTRRVPIELFWPLT